MRGDFGPAKCPICGSVGARALMLDHIEAEHGDLGAAWERTRWWRAIDRNGQLWAESSDEQEIRAHARPGDRVQVLMRREALWWADVDEVAT